MFRAPIMNLMRAPGAGNSPVAPRKNTSLDDLRARAETEVNLSASPLKLTLRFEEDEDKENATDCVFYKNDENRFAQRYTLKLKTFWDYNISVSVEPGEDIDYMSLGDRKCDQVDSTCPLDDGAERSEHKFKWCTKQIRPTERKHRSILPCTLKFTEHKEISFDLFVKFYYNCEDIHMTGMPLSHLELEKKNGSDEIDVQFR